MSWYRKVKSIYSISLVTISFIIWSTFSKWLFKNLVDYKLFLITLCIVFFTQYIKSVKLKKNIVILIPLVLSILSCYIFFKGQAIFLDVIFLLFIILITYSLEESPIDHSQYKEDINKSMVALAFIWLISFTLGIDFVNEIYKFHILYIIMIIMLMRETRGYVYNVKKNRSIVTNTIIVISVTTLSLDFVNKILAKLLDRLMDVASFIMSILVSGLIKIFGGAMSTVFEKLRQLSMKSESLTTNEQTMEIGKKFNNNPVVTKYEGGEISPLLILAFKIIILFLILYVIYKFLLRFRNETKIYSGFIEEKERIVKKKNKNQWVKKIFGKILEGGKSNREKILYTYKGFEKITEDADIYKPYMTATQLKNITKINVKNFDSLDDMTYIYNEAKFSLHDMTEEQVRQVKKGHSNIRKQL